MPLPLVAMGVGAAISAAIAAISEFQKSGDPQALAAAKQARGESIMEAMQRGMSRQEAEAQVDQNIQDAIVRNEYEFDASNVVGAGVVGGALGGLGSIAMSSKLAAQAMGKLGLGGKAAAQAAPVTARGVVPVGPVTPAQNVGTGFVRQATYSSRNAGAGKTYDVVPEATPQLGYQGGANPMQLGYNPSRLPPSALSAEEATLVRNLGIPNVPGPSSPFTPPGTGMPPMMVTNMLTQAEAEAIRAAGAARQAAYMRQLGLAPTQFVSRNGRPLPSDGSGWPGGIPSWANRTGD